ncbi:hypothetical protein U9M48_028775 [Paspalum notatum var. saurae]|uniref:Arabidopsis retrotransposon Orf1 C-terminal domain-containing protein n=1 Tax=Paspalum notatum var. saurae TaxID=547442 RepID=A0AAQ3U1U7_PASNO
MLPLRGCPSARRSLKNSRRRPPTGQYSSSTHSSCPQEEAKALRLLNQKSYALTKCFDKDLLVDTGMREEFNEVFEAVGWSDFTEISEGGIILLSKEFLMTLRTDTRWDGTYVWFRLFNTDYELTLYQFSNLLDFSPQYTLSEDLAGFNLVEFWKELVGPDAPRKKSIAHIRHATLRFLARWLTMVVSRRMIPVVPQ